MSLTTKETPTRIWTKPAILSTSKVNDAKFGGNPNFIDHFYPATNGNLGS